MVLLYAKEGQLANRLWQASFFIANAVEYKYFLLHLGFAEYCKYFNKNASFKSNEKNWRIIDFETTQRKDRLLIKYANMSKTYFESSQRHYPLISELNFFDYSPNAKGYDLSQFDFLNITKNRILMVDGWQFVDASALKKHAQQIKDTFTPNKEYLERVQELRRHCYLQHDIVVGVHLRKGDYATFNEGKWLYSNSEYRSFMEQVKAFPSLTGKKVAFLLCSDESINRGDFTGLDTLRSTENSVEDLYALSFCNLIIGPPSTYTSWASFYGNVPLLHITENSMAINENHFSVALFNN